MKKAITSDHKKRTQRIVAIPAAELVMPDLPGTDEMLHLRAEALQRGVLYSSDRNPEEERVLRFLAQALDPTAIGVAKVLGQEPAEAGVELGKLAEAGLVWEQVTSTGSNLPGWHLTNEGQRYLTDRGIFPPESPHP